MPQPGSTRVWNPPSPSPPRTLTAPISVIAQSFGEPPVVSRSTTTKVTSASGVPSSSIVACSKRGSPAAARAAVPARRAGESGTGRAGEGRTGRTVGRGADSPGDARRGTRRGEDLARPGGAVRRPLARPRGPRHHLVTGPLRSRLAEVVHAPALPVAPQPPRRGVPVRGRRRARRRAVPGPARGSLPDGPGRRDRQPPGQPRDRRAAAARCRRAGRPPGAAVPGRRGPGGARRCRGGRGAGGGRHRRGGRRAGSGPGRGGPGPPRGVAGSRGGAPRLGGG